MRSLVATAKTLLLMLLATVLLLAVSCGGGEPPADPTETPATTPSPDATPGGEETPQETATPGAETPGAETTPDAAETPAVSEAEREAFEYRQMMQKAKDLVLARNYEDAFPVLEEALEKHPDDGQVHFLFLLAHGNLEAEPAMDSKAYEHAEKVVELMPESNEAERAHEYIVAAHTEPDELTAVKATSVEKMKWAVDTHVAYELQKELTILTIDRSLSPEVKKKLWQLELYPEAVAEKAVLPQGSQLVVLQEVAYPYSKTAWRERVPDLNDRERLSSNIYNLHALKVQVVSGESDGTKGWMVNQMDRWAATHPDDKEPWAVVVLDRLGVGAK